MEAIRLKILIVTQYFHPEIFIINQIAEELALLGHQIVVLTGKPNYPQGKVYPGYSIWSIDREVYQPNIEIIRIPLFPRGTQKSALGLIGNYVSFAFFGSLLAPLLLYSNKFASIFVFGVSPITLALPAVFLKWFKPQSKLTLWVQDLWPDSLVATGYIKNNFILKAVNRLVKFIYKNCDLILAQSPTFINDIKEKLEPSLSIPVEYFPNSYRSETISDTYRTDNLELEDTLKNFKCLIFAGNIGTAQSIETIIQAAKILTTHSDIKFILIGSGSNLPWVQQQIAQHQLSNVILTGQIPQSQLTQIYPKATAMLLTLGNHRILEMTLPWKTQGYMAASKPIIGAINGEGARVIKLARCGYVGPAEDAQSLVQNILDFLLLSKQEQELLGQNGYQYFLNNFEMKQQVKKLEKLLQP